MLGLVLVLLLLLVVVPFHNIEPFIFIGINDNGDIGAGEALNALLLLLLLAKTFAFLEEEDEEPDPVTRRPPTVGGRGKVAGMEEEVDDCCLGRTESEGTPFEKFRSHSHSFPSVPVLPVSSSFSCLTL